MHEWAVPVTTGSGGGRRLKLREEATAIYREKYGPKHPHTLRSMGALAEVFHGRTTRGVGKAGR